MIKWNNFMNEKWNSNKVRLSIMPLFFNYANDLFIGNYIKETLTSFLQNSQRKSPIWMPTVKIFQYPNRVISVRVIICVFSKISKDESTSDIDDDIFQTDI